MSTMPNIHTFVEDTLHKFLNSVCDGFEDGEIAYLSSQGKNELQIRDKIAWRLHKEIKARFGDQYVVCREWSPEGFGRAKVDLAVLELNSNCDCIISAVALIEFKAQSIVRKEKWYLAEFEHDLRKMKEMAEKSSICKNDVGYQRIPFNFLKNCKYFQYNFNKRFSIVGQSRMSAFSGTIS